MWAMQGVNFGVRVVLLALPLHRSRAPQDNAFMAESSAGETPLMHLLRNDYPPAIPHILCLRGGGFSSREWESGAVLRLLTHHGDIKTLVDAALYLFRSDFLYRLCLYRLDHLEGVLQTYCRCCERVNYSDVRLFVEALGEDPRGAAEILRRGLPSLQLKPTMMDNMLKAVEYLDECAARRVRPRTDDCRD
jgi:hypothetical protein